MLQLLAHVTLADVGAIAAAVVIGFALGVVVGARLVRRQDARRARP